MTGPGLVLESPADSGMGGPMAELCVLAKRGAVWQG